MRRTFTLLPFLTLLTSTLSFATSFEHVPTKPLDPEGVPKRYDYKQSFKKPYFLYDDVEIPFFEHHGSTLLSHEYVRLTPSVPDSKGTIWSQKPNPHSEWQVLFSFSVTGRGYIGGEGFAFWYTSRPMQIGPMYGSEDKWEGLGIVFDTADQLENRYTPFIYGVMNHGKQEMAHRKDYLATSLGGACFRDYRNDPAHTWARVTYANRTIRLDIDLRQGGHGFVQCFEQAGIDLPKNYYFGLSSATEAHLADDHDIHSFEVYELEPKSTKAHLRPHEKEHVAKGDEFKMSDDIKKMIKKIEDTVESTRKQWDTEPPTDAINAHMPSVIQQLQGNQFHILESLNLILEKIGEPKIPHDSKAAAHATTQTEAIHAAGLKLDDVVRQLNVLSNEIRALTEQSQKTTVSLSRAHDKLDENLQKGSSQSSAPPPPSQSSPLVVGFIGFSVGMLVMWVISVVRRMGEEKTKKFI
ncbi:uncharacterized protein SPPG_08521 [Spizellomyces punctatus DAOM BR117]|uniref:L-type lectin-like domain-containing protein n=1 Tax=Spizellomyces punctatus (strain DAOM BR117) TaxID=645134 RepID=A0A0L0H597_SPIPD|nr:uncharacterized protein SPPG_08521 [Spizellomyces punctatus DAOM BR117]KNC96134.1 hypothetical protein SPPG_08521 [Spizellomyces punctatus DAOM BR117]|eukprot:XP_016604174.1 hypothetical protein SPPG_08521 [Spizellomyces punctatus DAOM BR117]